MLQKILNDFVMIPEVEAIQLVGSRAGKYFDDMSDYNIVVYTTGRIEEKYRSSILMQYCTTMEIGNSFWEYTDNAIMKDGVALSIVYRDLEKFSADINEVVNNYEPKNGFTTCEWAELENGKLMYDRNGNLKAAMSKYSFIYPPMMQIRVIDRNLRLLKEAIPNIKDRLKKAVKRNDRTGIITISSEFFGYYFDIIYAVNRKMQPGKVCMMQDVLRQCRNLPKNFEQNMNAYMNNMFNGDYCTMMMDEILKELDAYINKYKKI